jgi:membrane-associated phospholipid phosphatase
MRAAATSGSSQSWTGPLRRLLPLAFAAVLLSIGFTVIDPAVLRWARSLDPSVAAFFHAITGLGRSAWMLVPLAIGIAVLSPLFRYEADRKKSALYQYCIGVLAYIFVTVAFSALFTDLIKVIAGRARPELFDTHGPLNFAPLSFRWVFHSFPSGHAANIFALCAALALLAPRLRTACLMAAGLIAASRVMVNQHYFTDVAAGSLTGVWAAYYVQRWFTARGIVFAARPSGRMDVKGRLIWRWIWRS